MSPVLDHEVHVVTKIRADKPYGCYSRKSMSKGYIAPDKYYRQDGTFVVTQRIIEHNLSQSCRYDLSHKDLRCEGCTSIKDTDYLQMMGL